MKDQSAPKVRRAFLLDMTSLAQRVMTGFSLQHGYNKLTLRGGQEDGHIR